MDFLESALIGGGGEGATIILVLFFMLAIAETEVRFFFFSGRFSSDLVNMIWSRCVDFKVDLQFPPVGSRRNWRTERSLSPWLRLTFRRETKP